MNLWSQYVEIIYMPEYEANLMEAMSQVDARPEELAYGAKMEKADMEKRLNMLFGEKGRDGVEDADRDEQDAEAVKEDYETVNEGMTTDTTSGSDHESAVLAQAKAEAEPKSASSQPVKRVEEGIQSSDEEEDAAEAQSELDSSAQQPTAQPAGERRTDWLDDGANASVTAFGDLRKAQKPLYDTARDQDKQEHQHGFSSIHIEEYAAGIETKADAKFEAASAEGSAKDESDIETDFIGTGSLKDELADLDAQVGDLESLNLFGVSLDGGDIKTEVGRGATARQVQRVLADLVRMAQQIDPAGASRDFSKRKAFAYYDPYSPDDDSEFAHLRYED